MVKFHTILKQRWPINIWPMGQIQPLELCHLVCRAHGCGNLAALQTVLLLSKLQQLTMPLLPEQSCHQISRSVGGSVGWTWRAELHYLVWSVGYLVVAATGPQATAISTAATQFQPYEPDDTDLSDRSSPQARWVRCHGFKQVLRSWECSNYRLPRRH